MNRLTWHIGAVRVTRIVETEVAIPPEGLIPQATFEAQAPHRDWLYPSFVTDKGDLKISIHALAIESCGRKIIVDTCLGEHEVQGMKPQTDFLAALAEIGFAREDVDVVLCTHMHFDHVGWNTMKDGDTWVPTFPNARYLFAEREWAHFRGAGTDALGFANTFHQSVVPIVEAGLADLVGESHVVTDEVRLEPTPGHTPGHVSVMIESEGKRAMITGDATHSPVQWAEPDWKVLADTDTAAAARTRRAMIKMCIDSDLMVIGTHYATPTAGFVRSGANGVRFEGHE